MTEREDKAEHLIDNVAGAGPRFGVYQWLDKVYQAQIFNYGNRLLYDLIVPEPAALFLRGMALRQTNGVPIVRPAPFKLKPTDLNPLNWDYYVAGHQATGVEAPPVSEIIVSVPFGGRASNQFDEDTDVASFIIGQSQDGADSAWLSRLRLPLKCHSKTILRGQGQLPLMVGRRAFVTKNGVIGGFWTAKRNRFLSVSLPIRAAPAGIFDPRDRCRNHLRADFRAIRRVAVENTHGHSRGEPSALPRI